MANGNGLPPGLLGRRQKIPPPPQMEMLPDTLTGPERENYYRIFLRQSRMSQEEKDKLVGEVGQRPMHGLLQDSPGSYLDLMKSIYEEWPDKRRDDLPFPDVQPYKNTVLGEVERGEHIPWDDDQFARWVERTGDSPLREHGLYKPAGPRPFTDGSGPVLATDHEIEIGHYPPLLSQSGYMRAGNVERSLEDTLGHETFHALSARPHGYVPGFNVGVSPQTSFVAAVRALGRKSEGVGDWVGDEDGKTIDFTSLGPLSPEGAINYLVEIARKNYVSAANRPHRTDLVDAELKAVFNRLLALPTYRDHPIQAKGLADWTASDQRHGLLAPYTGFLAEVERE